MAWDAIVVIPAINRRAVASAGLEKIRERSPLFLGRFPSPFNAAESSAGVPLTLARLQNGRGSSTKLQTPPTNKCFSPPMRQIALTRGGPLVPDPHQWREDISWTGLCRRPRDLPEIKLDGDAPLVERAADKPLGLNTSLGHACPRWGLWRRARSALAQSPPSTSAP